RLTIELANARLDEAYATQQAEVTAGPYVMLAVTDTGTGMSPQVQARVFEPFFTTKPEGRGTGLGLPQVYGFVRQSGGHIRSYSEPDHGTAVKIYLPRAVDTPEWAGAEPLAPVEGGSETILVVEDDAEVRAGAVDVLAHLGYRVLQAADADQALEILRSSAAIDLLFTDVVMPGSIKAGGLALPARKIFPRIALPVPPGHTAPPPPHNPELGAGAPQNRELDAGAQLLTKPYRRDDLARKVRAVLAEANGRMAIDSGIRTPPPGATTPGSPGPDAERAGLG